MTKTEVKKYARVRILRATVILLTFFILLFLYYETRGDFANGILFFLNAMASIHLIIIFSILFFLTYIFAGKAGEQIIMERKNIYFVSLKYVVLISFSIALYSLIISLSREAHVTKLEVRHAMSLYFFPLFLKTGFSLLLVWLLVTSRFKSLKV